MSSKARFVYIYIIGQSEKWNPGLRSMANAIRISKDSVSRGIKELEKMNMLVITGSGPGSRDCYALTSPTEWSLPAKEEVSQGGTPVSNQIVSQGETLFTNSVSGRDTSKKKIQEEERSRSSNIQDPEKYTVSEVTKKFKSCYINNPDRDMKTGISELFHNLQTNGHTPAELNVSQIKSIKSIFVPDRKPKTITSSKYDSWNEMVNRLIDDYLVSDVVLTKPSDKINTDEDERDPRVLARIKMLMQKGDK
jgi:hypothetical protein